MILLKKTDEAFYGGIITALAILADHGEETLYREIIEILDVDELIFYAWVNGELDFSGLDKFGYVTKIGQVPVIIDESLGPDNWRFIQAKDVRYSQLEGVEDL